MLTYKGGDIMGMTGSLDSALAPLVGEYSSVYAERNQTMRQTFAPLAPYLIGKRVLDFGCGKGLSSAVMLDLGASHVTGVDTLSDYMVGGQSALEQAGYSGRVELHCIPDTRKLPFKNSSFDAITCNAVFEHIPQPRAEYIAELWRVLAPGGTLIINETPNKYIPVDFHTLHLPLTNWLPSSVAHKIGVWTGRFRAERTDWQYSGWRGAGYYELLSPIPKHERRVVPELANARHRALNAIGLPPNLLDPYPLLIVEKTHY